MRKLCLMNIHIFNLSEFDEFSIGPYMFHRMGLKKFRFNGKEYQRHIKNAYVTFNEAQKDSVIFPGGIRGYQNKRPCKRKIIEDILVIGSILNGSNWAFYSDRKASWLPLSPSPHLEDTLLYPEYASQEEIEKKFQLALNEITDEHWQKQFENGFHLIMLKSFANIMNAESRFLANFIIWEWLYSHLKNSDDSRQDENFPKIGEILDFILKYFWKDSMVENNIFRYLRNQLAHSGRLPINRHYDHGQNPEPWMTSLTFEPQSKYSVGIKDYLKFFDKLTQVIVLKTLSIDSQHIIHNKILNGYLRNGRIDDS